LRRNLYWNPFTAVAVQVRVRLLLAHLAFPLQTVL
jgi:hypothetical protein